ncbi:MAG TPA: D-alanyl-D-alanine carboxypeptidase [Candidatus Baltobacteraceae bacterium]|jgi:D-alanyl-D-alanine carboxypeptidase/D-alanyl-D-alanine-endopeptidase (penicillin-binding protein 4)
MIAFLALLLAVLPWTPAQIAKLHANVDRMLATAKTLRGAHVGFLAVDTRSGRVLYAHKSDDAFMPASTLKVITGSSALAMLGPNFTFTTQVATLTDGTTTKLVLIGGGDPLLSASDLDDAAAAVAAANFGPISEIDADTSRFDQERYGYGWTLDDIGEAYAPALTALCYQDNVADRQPRVDPEHVALAILARDLRTRGVSLPDVIPSDVYVRPPPSAYHVVWTHESKPLTQYLASMWYPSDNLIAEMLIKSMGVAAHGIPGTAGNGAKHEERWLRSIGINPALNTAIYDGSGVSIYDRLSPHTLVHVFQVDWRSSNRDTIVAALPLAGVRGTIRNSFAGMPARGRTYAKDGNRLFASSLAGYLMPTRHGTITFAFMVDDWTGDDDDLDRFEGQLLSRLIRS